MTSDDIFKKAKALLENSAVQPKALGQEERKALPAKAAEVLNSARRGLDVYIVYDTTGSMGVYINTVRDHAEKVTDALLDGKSDLRISMNGIGDHCDGPNWIQQYELSSVPEEVIGALEDIVMTNGGDEPEAYECLALQLAQRIPAESVNRKRAVVLIADSVPHGMTDAGCPKGADYLDAFKALKAVCDGFYFVGCNEQMYSLQRRLVDKKSGKEKFIPLGEMASVLPELLVALTKEAQSEKELLVYLQQLEPERAKKIYGLLGSGK